MKIKLPWFSYIYQYFYTVTKKIIKKTKFASRSSVQLHPTNEAGCSSVRGVGGVGIRVWPRGAWGACEALFALRHRRCSSSSSSQQARFISVCNHGAASHLPPASLLRHQVQPDPRGENPRLVIPPPRLLALPLCPQILATQLQFLSCCAPCRWQARVSDRQEARQWTQVPHHRKAYCRGE